MAGDVHAVNNEVHCQIPGKVHNARHPVWQLMAGSLQKTTHQASTRDSVREAVTDCRGDAVGCVVE